MKSYIVAFCFLMMSPIFSQVIHPKLWEETWQGGETREIYGHSVTKVFGEFPGRAFTYQYAPMTTIAYKSYDQLVSETRYRAKEEDWEQPRLNKNLDTLKQKAAGGRLMLYLVPARKRPFFEILRDIHRSNFCC